jgi:hypothetical protein
VLLSGSGFRLLAATEKITGVCLPIGVIRLKCVVLQVRVHKMRQTCENPIESIRQSSSKGASAKNNACDLPMSYTFVASCTGILGPSGSGLVFLGFVME